MLLKRSPWFLNSIFRETISSISDETLSEQERTLVLAHELGHLFLLHKKSKCHLYEYQNSFKNGRI